MPCYCTARLDTAVMVKKLGQRGCSQAQLGRAHTTDIHCQR